ncbi:retrovirus-related pol polyprotein from transposon TNT 1-94 [Tanacetum coccineum]
MGEPTTEEYMTKTRKDYGSAFIRPKIDDKARFEAASSWLRNEPAGSIDTWETLKKKFLSKYYPPARIVKKMEADKYGYIKNYKKTVKNGQARTRESEEYKKKPKKQSRSQKS